MTPIRKDLRRDVKTGASSNSTEGPSYAAVCRHILCAGVEATIQGGAAGGMGVCGMSFQPDACRKLDINRVCGVLYDVMSFGRCSDTSHHSGLGLLSNILTQGDSDTVSSSLVSAS